MKTESGGVPRCHWGLFHWGLFHSVMGSVQTQRPKAPQRPRLESRVSASAMTPRAGADGSPSADAFFMFGLRAHDTQTQTHAHLPIVGRL
uniref:Uncharacterized protein n=1 Tax=Knipowitschia caucasica TaxID=637954 RepID=A0AAV2J370_KNICA